MEEIQKQIDEIKAKMETNFQTRFICVCAKCGHHDSKTSIEINFRDKKIYHICPECKTQNDITITPPLVAKPYPKVRTMR